MAPLLIPVVTLVIALAGLVLAIFALVLIAAQRLDNAQLPARRRSDRDWAHRGRQPVGSIADRDRRARRSSRQLGTERPRAADQ